MEAAFRGIQKAAELIDMRKHAARHPAWARPMFAVHSVSNVSWKKRSRAPELGKRVGEELKIRFISTKGPREIRRVRIFPSPWGRVRGFLLENKGTRWKPISGLPFSMRMSGTRP